MNINNMDQKLDYYNPDQKVADIQNLEDISSNYKELNIDDTRVYEDNIADFKPEDLESPKTIANEQVIKIRKLLEDLSMVMKDSENILSKEEIAIDFRIYLLNYGDSLDMMLPGIFDPEYDEEYKDDSKENTELYIKKYFYTRTKYELSKIVNFQVEDLLDEEGFASREPVSLDFRAPSLEFLDSISRNYSARLFNIFTDVLSHPDINPVNSLLKDVELNRIFNKFDETVKKISTNKGELEILKERYLYILGNIAFENIFSEESQLRILYCQTLAKNGYDKDIVNNEINRRRSNSIK